MVGTSPAPLSGDRNVVFISQAVDATLSRAADGLYWVDAQGAVRLHNTDHFNVANVKLGWPGWPGDNLRFDLNQLSDFAPIKDGVPIETYIEPQLTNWGGEEKESNWLVSQITIQPDKRERIYFRWRQPLGSDILLTYSFGLQPAGAWQGDVGSTRITLNLPNFTSQERIVQAQPANYTFTGDKIEWILVDQDPTINPSVTLIAPHMWQEIEKARANRATDPLKANLQLADLYKQLVQAGVTFYEGEVQGALEAAYRAAPDDPEPQTLLAEFYRVLAYEEADNLALLEQAVITGEAALAAGANDEAIRSALVSDLQTLADLWAESNPNMALDFLKRAEAAGGDATQIEKQRRVLTESLVLAELARGDFQAALQVATAHGFPTDIATYPWLTSSALHIENSPGERIISFVAYGDEALVSQKIGQLANQLDQLGYSATWEGNRSKLTIRLSGDEEAWLQAGADMASVLSDEPELDLLRAALTSNMIKYRIQEDDFFKYYGYREQVEVESRASAIAEQIRQDAAQRESAWEQSLLNKSATHWQTLADSQSFRITTRFDLQGHIAERNWNLTLPVNETLEWYGDVPRHERWLLVAASGALGLLLLLALIWLPGRWR